MLLNSQQILVNDPFLLTLRFPIKLLCIQMTAADETCETRSAIAREILATEDQQLDITTLKIKTICFQELRAAAIDGKCGPKLFSIMRTYAVLVKVNIEELEGLNGLIKATGEQSPNISLELLDARLKIKKSLSVGGRLDTLSVKELKATATDLHNAILPVAGGPLPERVSGMNRYGAPAAIPHTLLPSKGELLAATWKFSPELRMTPSIRWATAYSLLLSRQHKKKHRCEALHHRRATRDTISTRVGAS